MHALSVRVYYEDTDLAGIVYYANYLKFIERGRSEWLRDRGIDQVALKVASGHVFAVRRVEADYLRPARFDDLLTVETVLSHMTAARIVVEQAVADADDVTERIGDDEGVPVLHGCQGPWRLPWWPGEAYGPHCLKVTALCCGKGLQPLLGRR